MHKRNLVREYCTQASYAADELRASGFPVNNQQQALAAYSAMRLCNRESDRVSEGREIV